jgi:anti-anti-sigma factor
MDDTTFLWIRFCPQAGNMAEVLRAQRDGERIRVTATETVPTVPPEEFEAAVADIIRREYVAGPCRCVVDLGQCPWLNSQGIGVMIAWYQLITQAKGRMVLVRPDTRVRNVLAITRLDQVFPIFATLEAGLDDLLSVA